MKGKAAIFWGFGIVALAAAAAYFVLFAKWGGGERQTELGDGEKSGLIAQHSAAQGENAQGSDSAAKRSQKRAGKKNRAAASNDDDDGVEEEADVSDFSPEDQKRMELIEKAQEDEDFKMLADAIPDIQSSTNAAVRSELVDALGHFGKRALVEMLPLMADPDEDVAQNALDQWSMALGEIEDEKKKCSYIESAMTVLTDEDTLESMMLELTDCDERLAIQTIINVVASGTQQAIAAAKEQYEFITGDEYTNIADAEAWLQENYEPDEE